MSELIDLSNFVLLLAWFMFYCLWDTRSRLPLPAAYPSLSYFLKPLICASLNYFCLFVVFRFFLKVGDWSALLSKGSRFASKLV